MEQIMERTPVRWDVPPADLARVLIPYRDNCKYLKKCSMELGRE